MKQPTRAWLVLAQAYVRVPELVRLQARFGSIDEITAAPASALRETGLAAEKCAAISAPDDGPIDAALAWLEDEGHHVVAWGEADYPPMLTEIPGPPLLLYVNGDIDALHMPSLAIVGSRNPTEGGVRNAEQFSRHLAARGLSIVSGLAQGIDTAAHRGALRAGGATVAVLGTGIDRVYPSSNLGLAHDIAAGGALVSEYPLGTAPERWHFPERNRLISGLSLGTLVVEAARRSGSLITARLAAEQGREVFALPGSIHNALARGCHALIRQGAKLVETADDIFEELQPLATHAAQATELQEPVSVQIEDDEDYNALRRCLGHDPVGIDELEKCSGLTIDKLSSMLLILELHGEVESLSGGRYALLS